MHLMLTTELVVFNKYNCIILRALHERTYYYYYVHTEKHP